MTANVNPTKNQRLAKACSDGLHRRRLDSMMSLPGFAWNGAFRFYGTGDVPADKPLVMLSQGRAPRDMRSYAYYVLDPENNQVSTVVLHQQKKMWASAMTAEESRTAVSDVQHVRAKMRFDEVVDPGHELTPSYQEALQIARDRTDSWATTVHVEENSADWMDCFCNYFADALVRVRHQHQEQMYSDYDFHLREQDERSGLEYGAGVTFVVDGVTHEGMVVKRERREHRRERDWDSITLVTVHDFNQETGFVVHPSEVLVVTPVESPEEYFTVEHQRGTAHFRVEYLLDLDGVAVELQSLLEDDTVSDVSVHRARRQARS